MKNGHKEKFEEILTENVQLEKVRITEFNGRIFPIFNTPLKLDCICWLNPTWSFKETKLFLSKALVSMSAFCILVGM